MAAVPPGLANALKDRYRLERELGQGGMATVYLAEDLRHRRQVAVKVLRPDLAAALGQDRFLREIETTASLHHPHILPLHDSGEAAGFLFYVMPFVDGESLRDRLNREKQLSIGDSLSITREVADALGYAHGRGLIHRDIKPENILLERGHATLADFGIARAVSSAGAEKLTQTGMAIGTPAYMSPEQSVGEGNLDGRSDLYSLGCVLYEMLAGEPPYSGPTAQAIMAKRFREPVPRISTLRETVTPALEAALTGVLAKSPADRFATAADFVAALDSRTPPTATVAVPTSGAARLARGLRLSRPALWSGAAALLLAGAAGLYYAFRGTSEKPLEANLIAVAPLTALDPRLAAGGQEIEAGLSRALDGMGPFRALAPTTVHGQRVGRIDAASAITLGQRTGAGLVVFGSLTPLGSDSVQASMTVIDVSTKQPLGDFEFRNDIGHISQLVDSATLGVLYQLMPTRRIGAGRLTGPGSRTILAVKSFLQGEQAFRRTAYDSALTYYQAAAARDSQFAMAYYRIGEVYGLAGKGAAGSSISGSSPDSLFPYLSRGGALNRGLSLHDSLMVATGACMGAVGPAAGLPDSVRKQRAGECYGIALQGAREFPNDVEAWFSIGLVRRWLVGLVSREGGSATDAFTTALAQDSSYGPLYQALIETALANFNFERTQRLAAHYLSLGPPAQSRPFPLLLARLLAPGIDTAAADRLLDSTPGEVLTRASYALLNLTDSLEATIRIGRALHRRQSDARFWLASGEQVRQYLAAMLLYRGHLKEAAEVSGLQASGWFPTVLPELVMWGAVPQAQADSVFGDWLTSKEDRYDLDYTGGAWWSRKRDSTSIRAFLRRNPGAAGPSWSAHLALARADTAEALRQFDLAGKRDQQHLFDPLVQAQLLIAGHRDAEALPLLMEGVGAQGRIGWQTHTNVRIALERGRVAERLGKAETAADAYREVTEAWLHADPSLQGLVQEARAGLARTSSEKAPAPAR